MGEAEREVLEALEVCESEKGVFGKAETPFKLEAFEDGTTLDEVCDCFVVKRVVQP